MNGKVLLIVASVFLTIHTYSQTLTDIDGNIYNTVTIGNQIWMKENLRVTHYNNGIPIPNVKNNSDWNNLTSGARSYYNNDSSFYAPLHGALYNWFATVGICPTNWHVPVENDFIILITYLGGTSTAGGKLKSVTGWNSPNTGATNSSGFSGMADGDRYDSGPFNYIGFFSHWWASTANGGNLRMAMLLSYDNEEAVRYYFNVNTGFMIRCVCDSIVTQSNSNRAEGHVRVYPNPATDRIYLDINDVAFTEAVIYSLTGKPLLTRELHENTNEINISSLAAGMYLIRVTGAEGSMQKIIIKE